MYLIWQKKKKKNLEKGCCRRINPEGLYFKEMIYIGGGWDPGSNTGKPEICVWMRMRANQTDPQALRKSARPSRRGEPSLPPKGRLHEPVWATRKHATCLKLAWFLPARDLAKLLWRSMGPIFRCMSCGQRSKKPSVARPQTVVLSNQEFLPRPAMSMLHCDTSYISPPPPVGSRRGGAKPRSA